ncbi:heterokaryon incompatibility protein-domain-containing protein [Hypoxylon trugodes]|uniref:heterokaryon incompatibility protein-domain-containing protein n=1 Tax=Hypoxylon trugodes TaxID=326681 RepID=UPI002192D406|nr:heterokaryon incompatibility protein-domain-containing protein [Hypoxylon trugodes]KAI1386674.1 heterokaryon incompatibility protein-domain-containing protein [Hypoxylon trugodes]
MVCWNNDSTTWPKSPRFLDIRKQNQRVIGAARAYFKKCVESHNCSSSLNIHIPTRLINVGIEGDEMIRLFEPGNSQVPIKSAALSYCWGGQVNTFKTTSQNVDVHYAKGFSLSLLPRTIRDAVEVTRDLGILYLWVDTLCIIQGEDETARDDWHSEVNRMHEVYRGAYVTISAASASNADGGLSSCGHCIVPCTGECWYASFYLELPGEDPIETRGWTLQEHVLSSRLLAFTNHGVQWRCNQMARETSRMELMDLRPNITSNWIALVENYCLRALSVESDKLPAIAALAHEHAKITGDKYLAGLWDSNILQHLLWYCRTGESRRPGSYRAPTWSWASVDARVKSKRVDQCASLEEVWHFFLKWAGVTELLAEVIKCEVQLENPEYPFSKVVSGTLTISGLVYGPIQTVKSTDPDGNAVLASTSAGNVGKLYYDPTWSIQNCRPTSYIVISSAYLEHASAIAIRPIDDSNDVSIRVGLIIAYYSESENMIQDGEVRTIKIV